MSQSNGFVEAWKEVCTIPGYEKFVGYRVSNLGAVESCWRRTGRGRFALGDSWRRLKPWGATPKKYPVVALSCPGVKKKKVYVHHLVLLAFVGPMPRGLHAAHRDDNPQNNTPSNLYWATREENMRDMRRNRGRPEPVLPDRYGNWPEVDPQTLAAIRRRYHVGRRKLVHSLAAEFGVPPELIYDVARGTTRH